MTLSSKLQRACALLSGGAHSLVLVNGDILRTFDSKGVADLYHLLTAEPALLRGAAIADKVVGKGAAALMIVGGVAEVYAEVISRPALDLFRAEGIEPHYGTLVPNIINRRGDGICPVETICLPCTTAADCIGPIGEFVGKSATASRAPNSLSERGLTQLSFASEEGTGEGADAAGC